MKARTLLAVAMVTALAVLPGVQAGAATSTPPAPSALSAPSTSMKPAPSTAPPLSSAAPTASVPAPVGGVHQSAVPPPVDPSALAKVNSAPAAIPRAVQGRPCITALPGNTATNNIAQRPWGQERLGIRPGTPLWQFGKGLGQTVAVIDTGVHPHPRLTPPRLTDGGDFVATQTGLTDCDGHGTLVAGIIAAAEDPATGFVGVAPEANILAIRQTSQNFRAAKDNQLRDGVGTTTTLANAIKHAADVPGVTVLNISEAACFPAGTAAEDQKLHAAVHDATAGKDIVVVVAAGNLDPLGACAQQNAPGQLNTIASPAWYDQDVLTVAAVDESGTAPPFDLHGPWVDVAAPGTAVVSLDPTGPGLTNVLIEPNQTLGSYIQGTSFACPYVAGVVALVRAHFPTLDAYQVMDRIKHTAQHPGGAGGRDDVLGDGVVDPIAALTDVLPAEQGVAAPTGADPGRLDLSAAPPPDPVPRGVALVGTGVGVGVLGLTMFTLSAVRRSRQLQRARATAAR